MLSVLLFGLHKQPNTHTPNRAMGGIRLAAGGSISDHQIFAGCLSRLSDSPLWMVDTYSSADERLRLCGGSRRNTGGLGTNNLTGITFANDGTVRIAFENHNRIGQSQSRKRHRSP